MEVSGIEPLSFSLQKKYSTFDIILPNVYIYSSVAQWLELSAVNRKVAGSIPACGVLRKERFELSEKILLEPKSNAYTYFAIPVSKLQVL